MSYRSVFLIALGCCAAFLVAAERAAAQMTIREFPLNSTAAWKKHVALLRENRFPKLPPPLPVSIAATPAVSTPQPVHPTVAGDPAVLLPPPTLSPDGVPQEWRDRIRRASSRYGVAEALLAAVLKAESNFDPYAVSPKGARGAMQIMPATGRELGLRNFFDPEENLDAGASYLASLLREFSPTLALAAYNAGPAAVRRHGGLPPYEETRNYVARVLALFDLYRDRLR